VGRAVREMEAVHKGFTGFLLYDPDARKTKVAYQADRYFTPASNTKILTLFAGLQLLGDSVPALRYAEIGDSLIIMGTGDPSLFSDRVFTDNRVEEFLTSHPLEIFLANAPARFSHFGPGWAWDDYGNSYSPERSAFPLYGNLVKVKKGEGARTLELKQPSFRRYIWLADSVEKEARAFRDHATNNVSYFPSSDPAAGEWDIPFRSSPILVASLLSDTLHRPVCFLPRIPAADFQVLKGVPADSLYRVMMQDSDNFIAEQILIMASLALGDTLDPRAVILHVQKRFLFDLPDALTWVDGSGLSRYNQFTPRSVVRVWDKISALIPERERLFSLLATGGVNGTVRSSYQPDTGEPPYIYGKTGSLRNNHCISGYLIAKSGRTYIFSLMNSNFATPNGELRKDMERVLRAVRDRY
jgi:D-alanyl-D-alanine carboxypeptidase/D-alanyl-D-alanine-endopeptidase (penicillin-binding protein 4)